MLRSYVAGRKFQLHDFVVMPDHVHLLITVGGDMTIERAMQFVKGGFSFRLRKVGIWGRSGSADFRRCGSTTESFLRYRDYIAENPVKAGLVDSPEEFPYCFTYLAKTKGGRG